MNSWKDGKFILVLEDGMNTSKVLGTMQAPGRYDPEVIQEGRGAGKNGYNVSFKGRSRHENYFFTGTITLALSELHEGLKDLMHFVVQLGLVQFLQGFGSWLIIHKFQVLSFQLIQVTKPC